MPPRKGPRLPFAPVVEQAKAETDEDLSQILGFSRKWTQRHRCHDVPLTLDQADRCAHALGVHPTELWPHEYVAAVAATEEED